MNSVSHETPMTNTFDIHPDFQAIKGREQTLSRWPLALLNGFLNAVNALSLAKLKDQVTHLSIEGPNGNRIPLLIVKPENLAAPSPALLYYHGGAFVFRHAPPHIANAVRYAREAHCHVIIVDYRLAPKDPFPAGFNDCYTALKWVIANASTLGIDTSRIAVGGDSAGGAFAASAAQKAAHEDSIQLCGQLLIYPVTDSDGQWMSRSAFSSVPPFKAFAHEALWNAYLGHPVSAGTPQYAAPLRGDLSGLAPAYVETAEFDPLRDEGKAYADALAAKGVDVSRNDIKRAIHGFDLVAGGSSVSQGVVSDRIQFLRKVFRS
jgi:acetyl esterase/lipase